MSDAADFARSPMDQLSAAAVGAPLSEILEHMDRLSALGVTGRELSRAVGHSPAWVTRKLTIWRGASAELRQAWSDGTVSERVAARLAELPADLQVVELGALRGDARDRAARAHVARPGRKRPSIDILRSVLAGLEEGQHHAGTATPYSSGVLDALRWALGKQTSEDFVKLINQTGDQT